MVPLGGQVVLTDDFPEDSFLVPTAPSSGEEEHREDDLMHVDFYVSWFVLRYRNLWESPLSTWPSTK